MYKTLVNNGINYLPTGAGFLPSTVSLVPSWEPHYPKKHVPTIRFPLTSSQGKETWWKDVISPPHQSQFNQFSGEKVITTIWITFENYVYISNSFLEVWALELQQMFCLSPGLWFYRQGGLKNPPDSFSEETWRVWTWSRFWDDFFLENRKCLPRKWRNITWKGTISKGKACLPTIIFQGIFVSFWGSTKNVPLRMCISYLKMFVLHCRVSFRRCLISFFFQYKEIDGTNRLWFLASLWLVGALASTYHYIFETSSLVVPHFHGVFIRNLALHTVGKCRLPGCSHWRPNTVDKRNPAPPGMYKTLYIMGQTTYQVVQHVLHQQYHFGKVG